MKQFVMLLGVGVILAGLTSILGAQDLRPLAVEDTLRVRSFFQNPPVFSPDGRRLAFTVTDNGDRTRLAMETRPNRMPPTDIYISDVQTSATSNITGGNGSNWLPVWSPDGHYLAFFSSRGNHGRRVWTWDARKDLLRMVSDLEVRGDQIEWAPDGRSVAVAVLPRSLITEGGENRAKTQTEPSDPGHRTPGSTVTVYQSGGRLAPVSEPWSLEGERCDLILIEVISGKTTSIAKAQRVSRYSFSPDGSAIAFTDPVRFEKPGSQQILFDLVTVSLGARQRQVLALNIRLDFDGAQFSWSPDGRELSFQTGGLLEKNHDCYVVDARLGGPRNVTGLPQDDSSYKTAPPLWDPLGKELYFIRDGSLWQASIDQGRASELAKVPGHRAVQVASKGANELWTVPDGKSTVVVAHDVDLKQDGFYRIDLTSGEALRLLERGQCYTCAMQRQHLAVSDDGQRLAYFAEDAQHGADLWMSDASFRNPRRVTNLNPQFDKYKMGSSMLVKWLSDDGETLRGALLLPPDYESGKRYPVVVWVYGGLTLSDNLQHFGLASSGAFNMQLLATRGYVVLLPDAPLGAGRPMLDLTKTVVPGLNRIIDMGIADPNRLGIMGHSYGGYSTLALIAETRRFRAAIEVDGFADMMAFYGEMDQQGAAFGVSFEESSSVGGTPWQSRQRYIENSPIFYLDGVDTPLLVMQGAADETVSPFLADEVFVGLRRLGKEVEYAKYRGEGHSPLTWSYPNQQDLCTRIIEWFDRHLRSRMDPIQDPTR